VHAGCAYLFLTAKPVLLRKGTKEVVDLSESAVFCAPLDMLDEAHHFIHVVRRMPGVAHIWRCGITRCALRQEVEKALPCKRLRTDPTVRTNEIEQRIEF
jgi:hypothetical protein